MDPITKAWYVLLRATGEAQREAWRDHKMLLWPKAPTQSEVDWERQQVAHLLSIAAAEYVVLRAGELEGPWATLVLLNVQAGLEDVDWGFIAAEWIR